jgi:hypothetical protein
MKILMCDRVEQKIMACCRELHDETFPDFNYVQSVNLPESSMVIK